jgi:hypothetical protein
MSNNRLTLDILSQSDGCWFCELPNCGRKKTWKHKFQFTSVRITLANTQSPIKKENFRKN